MFDYDATDTPDDETVRAVAAEISGIGLKPLSDEERLQRQIDREIWQEEQRRIAEERRVFRERKQAEEAEAARRAAAAAAAAAAAQSRRERALEIARQSRERALADLHLRLAQQESWQRGVETATRNAIVQQEQMQQFGRVIAALDATINPPAEPEPQVIVVESPEPETFCGAPIPRWRK